MAIVLPPDLVVANYQRTVGAITQRTANAASNLFNSLGSYRDSDAEVYVQRIVPVVQAAQRQTVQATKKFYELLATSNGFKLDQLSLVQPTDFYTDSTRGVPSEVVYTRPFVETRRAIANNTSMTQAILMGAVRVANIAATDIQLAKTRSGQAIRQAHQGSQYGLTYHVRVLTGTENCALCYVASTQRYKVSDLQPIHGGCDCTERPVFANEDPGQVINAARLEATHQAVEERFGGSARDARQIDYRQITIHEHGELGPVLTVKGQNFTGPSDI